MIVILDSGVLALIASPIRYNSEMEDSEVFQCNKWFDSLLAKGVYAVSYTHLTLPTKDGV